LDIGGG